MSFATCDLCDANEAKLADGSVRVLDPLFRPFGRRAAFAGPVATLKVFEDNALVRAALEEGGAGRVLVIDGGGSRRRALVGGNLGRLAEKNGWAGLVVNGCVRDSDELNACAIGVRALATHPRKSGKRGVGERDIAVQMAGVVIHPGEWLYADADGVMVSAQALA
jgi:regulator of ribonuclease activity A